MDLSEVTNRELYNEILRRMNDAIKMDHLITFLEVQMLFQSEAFLNSNGKKSDHSKPF